MTNLFNEIENRILASLIVNQMHEPQIVIKVKHRIAPNEGGGGGNFKGFFDITDLARFLKYVFQALILDCLVYFTLVG